MYILIALVLLFVLLWFVVRPWWQSRSASAPAQDKPKTASKKKPAKIGQMYKGLRGGFKFRSDTRELAQQFKQWVADAALSNRMPVATESFASWLGGLSAQELEQFTEKVARYCDSVNFDIAWLTNAHVARDPELKQAVEDAVMLHCLGAWRTSSVQSQVQISLAYQAWLTNPKRHQKFGQELHGALIERSLVTVPSELYLASEKERLAQAATAIRHAAAENPDAFRLALRQLAGVPESPATVVTAAT